MGILKEFKEIEKMTSKLQAMIESGEDEYAKTHSLCCDSLIINGICASCKDHTVSQSEE